MASIITPNDYIVLLIKHPRVRNLSTTIEPKVLISSESDPADSSKILVTSRWQCKLTPRLTSRSHNMMLQRLDHHSDLTIPEFKFLHCIAHNATDETTAKCLTYWFGSTLPLMKGGERHCKFSPRTELTKTELNGEASRY